MSEAPEKLPPEMRAMCIAMLTRIGGVDWAYREVDTPQFIERAEKIMVDAFFGPNGGEDKP